MKLGQLAEMPTPGKKGTDLFKLELNSVLNKSVPFCFWAVTPNKKGVGFRWQDPKNQGNGVRIDKGEPDISQPTQQVDHVIVRSNGRVIGRDGKPVSGSIKEHAEQVHIPLSEYKKWKSWNSLD